MKQELFSPPRLRLAGSKEKRAATWLELFFDLVFVIAVAELVHRLAHHISFADLMQFTALFIPVWWAWVGHTVYATRFDTDDLLHRLLTLAMMFAAAVMAVQIPTALEGGAAGFAAGYVLARLCLLLLYGRASRHVPEARQMTALYLSGFGLGAFCWLISIALPPPVQFVWWYTGISIDFLIPWLGRKRILQKFPLDTSHLPERFGLLTIIVLGETLLAVVAGLSAAEWELFSFSAAVMGFILAVSIWWLYFTYIHAADHQRNLGSGQPFIYLHLPLVISLAAIGAGVRNLIIHAHAATASAELKMLLAGSSIIWLLSFLLIQYVSIERSLLKPLSLYYAGGGFAILLLSLPVNLPPLVVLGLLNITFLVLLSAGLRVFRAVRS